MPAPDVHALTGAYLLDAITADERTGFERHLGACHACATDIGELAEAVARLGVAAEAPVPPRLKSRVLAVIGEVRQLSPPMPVRPVPDRRPQDRPVGRRTVLALAAAALAAVAGAGIAVDQHRDVVTARRDSDELMSVLGRSDARTLRGPVAGGGQATVVLSRHADAAVVVLRGLPALPRGRTYQMWLMDGRGTARSAGLAGGEQTRLVRGLRPASQFGLTVEPAGGSARPTLPAVAMITFA